MKELAPGLRQFGAIPPDGRCGAIYIVGQGKDLALVDAGNAHKYPLLKQELKREGIDLQNIKSVYITHGHGDHYEGAARLSQESDATIYVGAADRAAVSTGDYWKTAGFFYGENNLPLKNTKPIGNGYEQKFGSITLRAIETPGHTPGSITYELDIPESNARIALMGDTAWGGWHELIGSDLIAWKESIEILKARNYTSLSFGHGVIKLVQASAHLDLLQTQIGKYHNAYDNIPEGYFDITKAIAAGNVRIKP